MPVDILMPSLDPSMEQGRIVKWLKSQGDQIAPGDVLVEIETEKAIFEVEAESSGIMGDPLVAEGEYAPVNTAIGVIHGVGNDRTESKYIPVKLDKSQNSPPFASKAFTEPKKSSQYNHSEERKNRIFASPLARRLASLNGLDLSQITGTGPHGRIVKVDIEAVHQDASEVPSDKTQAAQTPQAVYTGVPKYESISHSAMRKTIARRITEAWQQVPHYFLNIDCEVDSLLNMRRELNDVCDDANGISLNDLIVRSAAIALTQVPNVNVAWSEMAVLKFSQVDVAIAVAVPGGLVTPVIRNAAGKNLIDIANESRNLILKAKAGKLVPSDYQGGTFTISNLGMYGIKSFTSIINPPQSAILSVGTAEQRAVVKNGVLDVATIMSCTLAVDHRCIDGVIAAEFLVEFKRLMEKPLSIMLQEKVNA